MAAKKTDEADDRPEDDVDARIERLKRKAASLNDGRMWTGVAPDCPPGIVEQFWKQIVAFESAVEEQPFDVLIRSGLTLPPPEELDDAQITVKLWEVIRGLAFLRVFLLFTDHLSDRELYARLWSDILRVPTALEPEDYDGAWHIDLTGTGSDSEEGIAIYLKYYADDNERRSWQEEWPDDPLPDREQRPFDRDRYLPRPPF
jgi:hypothetical protein